MEVNVIAPGATHHLAEHVLAALERLLQRVAINENTLSLIYSQGWEVIGLISDEKEDKARMAPFSG